MTEIAVIGGGAFGTALAIALASDGTGVVQWMRDATRAQAVESTRENTDRLAGARLPDSVRVTAQLGDLATASIALMVLPAQETEGFLAVNAGQLPDVPLILCAKGITLKGFKLQSQLVPDGRAFGILTGPSFAVDIAQGRPTALTIAAQDGAAETYQRILARRQLRLYRSDDVTGAQLGGALKNVVAISAGIAIGAGLGDSARAALMTRGFAEMRSLATALGAEDQTLSGLSGFGDLVLTCSTDKSRNYAHGLAIGRGTAGQGKTVEGVATARATVDLAAQHGVPMPISQAVADVLAGTLTVSDAMGRLLDRPLRAE